MSRVIYHHRMPLHRLAWLAAFSLILLLPHPALRLPAILFFFCVAPAKWLAARAGQTPFGSVALMTNIAPVLLGGAALLLLLLGTPPDIAPWIAALVAGLSYVLFSRRLPEADREDRRILTAVVVVVATVSLFVFLLPLTNLWWRVRSDSWFHAAVLNRLANHGLPVTDPYFSGLRLQYMYFYHVLLLCVSKIGRLDVFYSMILLNFVALTNLALAFAWLTGFFARRFGARVLALVLCMFGMNGLFYVFTTIRIARAFLGDTTGVHLLGDFFRLTPPGHDTASAFLSIEGGQFLFLDKFMLGTALSLALGLMCTGIALALSAKRRWVRWWFPVAYVSCIAGLMMLHIVIGAVVAAALAGAGGILWAARRPGGRYGHVLLLTLLGVLLILPYIRSVLPADGGGGSVGFSIRPLHLIGLMSTIFPALLFVIHVLAHRRTRDRTGRAWLFVGIWLLLAAGVAVIVDLPTNSETKFSFLLHIPLCALAATGIEDLISDRSGRRLVAVAFLLVTIPLNGIYFVSAFLDRTTFKVTADERGIYRWIREETEANAVFIDEGDIVRVPVLGERDLIWGSEKYARLWGYPEREMAKRRAVRDRIFSEGTPTDDQLQWMQHLAGPVYVVCRRNGTGGDVESRMIRSDKFVRAFEWGSIAVYRLEY